MHLKRFTSEVALLNSVMLSLENDLQIAPKFGFLKSRKLTLKIIMIIFTIPCYFCLKDLKIFLLVLFQFLT